MDMYWMVAIKKTFFTEAILKLRALSILGEVELDRIFYALMHTIFKWIILHKTVLVDENR